MRDHRPELYDDGGDDTTYLGNDDIRREDYKDRLPDDIGRVAYGNLGVEPTLDHPRLRFASDEGTFFHALKTPSHVVNER